jgi:GNAT superfamily N-acetyltransferase
MWWRIKRKDFERQQGDANRQAMREIVEADQVPGILFYEGDEPVVWCSVAPREDFPVLARSPILKPVDDQPVWSIVCFFLAKPYRSQGLLVGVLTSAVEYARNQGARIIEGYPIQPKVDHTPDIYAFTGMVSTFEKAGFKEVIRRSKSRPIMRYFVEG